MNVGEGVDKPLEMDDTASIATENTMPYELQQENESDLQFALTMYGRAIVDFHKDGCPAHYDNMCFWQEQVNHCAKAVAAQTN